MTITPVTLWGPVMMTNSVTLLGQIVPIATTQVIKRAVFTNTDTVNQTFNVYISRAGQAQVMVIDAQVLAPGQAYIASELANLVLNVSDSVYGYASVASKISTMASGWQQ